MVVVVVVVVGFVMVVVVVVVVVVLMVVVVMCQLPVKVKARLPPKTEVVSDSQHGAHYGRRHPTT